MEETATETRCRNCDTVYSGNFCPHCGQAADTSRLQTRSFFVDMLKGLLRVNRGLLFTGWNLLIHPWQVIRDYIQCRRVGQPRSSIRFSSSNIQPGDVTDVIAILDAVSSRAENCMELPDLQPVQTSIESIPVVDNGIPTVDTPEPKPEEPEEDDDSILTSDDPEPEPQRKRPRLFGLLKDKLTKMMSDDDDYEFESDDDKN